MTGKLTGRPNTTTRGEGDKIEYQCRKCKGWKQAADFHRMAPQPKDPRPVQRQCKACIKENRDPYKRQEVMWKHKYGITRAEFEALLEAQDGKCAICGATGDQTRYGVLCVDHDHETKKVRGLLCEPCNLGLGKFQDSPARLRSALAYLEKPQ